MFSTIIVGWVDTESANAALEWAASRAGLTPVRIITVVPGRETGTDYLSPTSSEAQARVHLIEIAERSRERHTNIQFETEVVRGAVVDQLNQLSAPGTLLVVGSTPRSQRQSDFGWSIATRVAGAHLPGTVAVVPSGYSASGRAGVIVGIDASPASEDVLRTATEEAVQLNEELTIVHAWTAPPYWHDAYVPDFSTEDSLQNLHQRILDGAAEAVPESSKLHIRAYLVNQPAAAALSDAARDAAEIVIGNHSSRGIQRFLLGSVSHAVLRDLRSPTIVVRS